MTLMLLIWLLLSMNSGVLLVQTKTPGGRIVPTLFAAANAIATPVLMFANVGPTWSIPACGLIITPTIVILIRGRMTADRKPQPLASEQPTPASREPNNWPVLFTCTPMRVTRLIGLRGVIGFLIPGITIVALAIAIEYETGRVSDDLISWEQSQPWRKGLTANVYWDKAPSEETRAGFERTAILLDVRFEHVSEGDEANIRIWPDTETRGYCKLGTIAGFVSRDPITEDEGLESGDIYLCRWLWRPDKPHLTDYSLMAHETAHLLAGVGHHPGGGLMAEMGGDRSQWFSEEEIRWMCDRINTLSEVKRRGTETSRKPKQVSPDESHDTSVCDLPASN